MRPDARIMPKKTTAIFMDFLEAAYGFS